MTQEIKEALELMQSELETHVLTVALVPVANPSHPTQMKRVAIDKNPSWYSDLCRRFPSSRIDNPNGKRTKIKRADVLRVFGRVLEGKPSKSYLYSELLQIAKSKANPF